MRTFKKSLALLLALVMVLALGVNAFAADEMLISLDPVGDVTVYYTNDVHTYIDSDITYSMIAALKASTPNALLVDAGDHAQGTAYGSMDDGETIIKLMNAAGYDVATLGNHEFDYGQDGRINITDVWAEYPYVSCNFYNEKNGVAGDPVLDAYKVFEVNGVKVAFVGVTTPESFTKSTPAYFMDDAGNYIYGIAGGTDGKALYAAVQKAIDAAAKEADIVIGLGHLGDDPSSDPWNSEDVIANTCGFDAFIDGHSHSTNASKEVTDKDGHTVILTQTGEYLDAVGKMTITADGAITTELLVAEDLASITADADVKAIEDAWISDVDTLLDEVIGSIDDTLDNYDADGNRLVRKQETNTGNFCADALYYLFDNMDMDVDVAIMNGGGIRNKAVTGDITYKVCKTIHTFGNVACLQTITGQQLLDALEWGARDVGSAECGGFLHVSGITYNINTYIPSTVQADDKGVWIGGPTGEYRVTDVKILQDGKYVDLDLNAEYNLAGYNYTLRDLGDGFAMFDGAVNVLDYVMDDYMVLANYVKSFEGGKVTGYAEPQGRITQKASPFTDVAPSDWFFSYVVAETNAGVIDGMGDGTYAPAGELTWAQALKLLLTAHGDLKDATGANWSKATIAKAASLGLVSADLDGSKAISRLDFCKAAAQLYNVEPSAKETIFTDCDNVYVTALVEAGVINGMGGNIFAPDATLTRAQIAKILYCLDK